MTALGRIAVWFRADFGAELSEGSLIPGDGARLREIRFLEWLGQPALTGR